MVLGRALYTPFSAAPRQNHGSLGSLVRQRGARSPFVLHSPVWRVRAGVPLQSKSSPISPQPQPPWLPPAALLTPAHRPTPRPLEFTEAWAGPTSGHKPTWAPPPSFHHPGHFTSSFKSAAQVAKCRAPGRCLTAWDLRSMKPEYRNSSAGCSRGWPPVGGEGVRSLIGSVGGQQGLDCVDLEGTLRNLWDP